MFKSVVGESQSTQIKSVIDQLGGFEIPHMDDVKKAKVFGVEISQFDKSTIPEMIGQFFKFIEEKGRKKKYIFTLDRKNVDFSKCMKFVTEVEDSESKPEFERLVKELKLSPFEVAALIKFFFLKLNEPVINRSNFDGLVISEIYDKCKLSEEGMKNLKRDVEGLSESPRALLDMVVLFIKKFSNYHGKTKMNEAALCESFGGVIIRGETDSLKLKTGDSTFEEDIKVSKTLLYFIVKNYSEWLEK